ALGIEILNERETSSGAGEGVRMIVGDVAGVRYDLGEGITLANQGSICLPMRHIDVFEGRPAHGLIGSALFQRYVAEIDYAKKRLHLYGREEFRKSGIGIPLSFTFTGHLVTLAAKVGLPDGETVDARLVVDTGARTCVMFNRPFIEKHNLTGRIPGLRAATVGGGAGGESRGLVGRVESLKVGDLTIRRPVAVLTRDKSGVLVSDKFDGIIGGPVLMRYRPIFDYTRKELTLQPGEGSDAPYEYDMSGLFLTGDGPDFREFRVMSVMTGSPAEEADLRRGDVILSVDGRRPGSLDELRGILKEEGKTRRLEVKRGEKRFVIEMVLRKLV
ncbi:MAG: retropepsin-like aspartic protease, partial [Planctomycetota bacterium]